MAYVGFCVAVFALVMIIVSMVKPELGSFKNFPQWGRKDLLKRWGVVFFISFFVFMFTMPTEVGKNKTSEPEFKKNIISQRLNLDKEDELNSIQTALKQVGITEIDSMEPYATYDEPNSGAKGWKTRANEIPDVVLVFTPNKQLKSVIYMDRDLYKDGKMIETLQANSVSREEQIEMKATAEAAIKKILNTPSTAKFSNYENTVFAKIHNEGTVTGYVDAQNAFGTFIRSRYQAVFDCSKKRMTHLDMAGQRLF